MATFDKTGVGGTTGHPSNGRTPYLVENTVDLDAFNPAANDIVQAVDIPAESIVVNAGIEVLTACSSSVTLDLGDAGDVDKYVDGYDATSTGFTPMVGNVSNVGFVYGAADTLDVIVLGAQAAVGKIRVWAIVCDISGIDETDNN